ncbi:hypothetical protein J6590_048050, partial [Homalodisca vitripennis]
TIFTRYEEAIISNTFDLVRSPLIANYLSERNDDKGQRDKGSKDQHSNGSSISWQLRSLHCSRGLQLRLCTSLHRIMAALSL